MDILAVKVKKNKDGTYKAKMCSDKKISNAEIIIKMKRMKIPNLLQAVHYHH